MLWSRWSRVLKWLAHSNQIQNMMNIVWMEIFVVEYRWSERNFHFIIKYMCAIRSSRLLRWINASLVVLYCELEIDFLSFFAGNIQWFWIRAKSFLNFTGKSTVNLCILFASQRLFNEPFKNWVREKEKAKRTISGNFELKPTSIAMQLPFHPI